MQEIQGNRYLFQWSNARQLEFVESATEGSSSFPQARLTPGTRDFWNRLSKATEESAIAFPRPKRLMIPSNGGIGSRQPG